ncbi:hypothetical protein WJX73_006206 [Symbiochloris irregularis]|uniref:Uncharacterized protein n=1 Tax=Symbiochloris irregularis TaxID=706552 RepID=A0AAW1NZD4_9CHLO
MDVFRAALQHWSRHALVSEGSVHRYRDLVAGALRTAESIHQVGDQGKPTDRHNGPRVAIMAPPGRQFTESLWGTWLAGSIAVPLCLTHPPRELQYALEDAQVSTVLASQEHVRTVTPLALEAGCHVHTLPSSAPHGADQDRERLESAAQSSCSDRGALIIYTSGTTGRPKGVLHTHGGLAAQTSALRQAWAWAPSDRLLHALPLHHIHGLVVALLTAHTAGACVECLPSFSPKAAWSALQRQQDPVTLFMGVPTMYDYLLNTYDKMDAAGQEAARGAAARLRLTVSGSAACPLPIMQRWQKLAGQTLLERYGMTETGMILSNPMEGERRPGSVGLPLPGVEVRLEEASQADDGETGGDSDPSQGRQLLVRGAAVFKEYWNRAEATEEAFDTQGFFMTGDTAAQEGSPAYWRILGRTSVDIINSGGYKISALGIEDVLLGHPGIAECAVLSLPDDSLGESIAAIIAWHPDQEADEDSVLAFAQKQLPRYQVRLNNTASSKPSRLTFNVTRCLQRTVL